MNFNQNSRLPKNKQQETEPDMKWDRSKLSNNIYSASWAIVDASSQELLAGYKP